MAGQYLSENIKKLQEELKEKLEEKASLNASNAEKIEYLQRQLEEHKNEVISCVSKYLIILFNFWI